MLKIIDDLFDTARYVETPNVSGVINPKFIVLHTYKYPAASLDNILTGGEPSIKLSTHLSINDAGELTQYAPFTAKCWHAGASYWQGYYGLNNCAIGINVEALGQTTTIWEKQVYSLNTLDTLEAVVKALVEKYRIRDIVTSSEVCEDEERFTDDIPTQRYRQYVSHGNADSLGRYEVTSPINLNIRGGPDVKFEVIDQALPGEVVKIGCQRGQWSFILFERRDGAPRKGWVYSSFLRRL